MRPLLNNAFCDAVFYKNETFYFIFIFNYIVVFKFSFSLIKLVSFITLKLNLKTFRKLLLLVLLQLDNY